MCLFRNGQRIGIEFVYAAGMDVTLSDYDGRTALHLAASEGHLDCIQFLLDQCHVPHDPKDRWGNIPLDEAETFGHHTVVDFLKAWDERIRSQTALNAVVEADKPMESMAAKPLTPTNEKHDGVYDKSAQSSPIPGDNSSDKPLF